MLIRAGVLAWMVILAGLLPSAMPVQAAQGAATGHNCPTPSPSSYQMRAAWISTVGNIDWPTRPGLTDAQQQQQFIGLLNKVQQIHLNTVIVQVRPAADALYPSKLFPWSQYLTGVQGRDPGYNPLAFILDQAHRRNLQVQAWVNPYRVSTQDKLSALAPNNPARQHPTWVISYKGQLLFNPGLPEVRDYIIRGMLEIVNNYAVDGIHLDDHFYPVADQTFNDRQTYRRYGAGFTTIGNWRRHNVNLLVKGVHEALKAARPLVSFGISPFGVWRNQTTDPSGSATHARAQNYDDLYADTRTWIKNNWLDYIAPQIYWNIGFAPAAYEVLVPWWAHEVAGTRVQLYIGMAVFKIGLQGEPRAWLDPAQMPEQLALDQKYPAIRGNMFFSIKSLVQNPLGFTDHLSKSIYKCPALVPPISSQSAYP